MLLASFYKSHFSWLAYVVARLISVVLDVAVRRSLRHQLRVLHSLAQVQITLSDARSKTFYYFITIHYDVSNGFSLSLYSGKAERPPMPGFMTFNGSIRFHRSCVSGGAVYSVP